MSREKFSKIVEALGTGGRLRELRQRAGISLTELARILGFHSASTVMNYEKGKRIPDEVTLAKLADLYKVSVKWLLTGHDPSASPPHLHAHLGRKEKRLLREIDKLLQTGDQIVVRHLRRQVDLLKDAVAYRRREKA